MEDELFSGDLYVDSGGRSASDNEGGSLYLPLRMFKDDCCAWVSGLSAFISSLTSRWNALGSMVITSPLVGFGRIVSATFPVNQPQPCIATIRCLLPLLPPKTQTKTRPSSRDGGAVSSELGTPHAVMLNVPQYGPAVVGPIFQRSASPLTQHIG